MDRTIMAAVPIYVWNGSAWQEIGPTIPATPIAYQASAPASPSTGDIWVDSDGDVTTGSQQFQRFRFVASGGETTISGADADGAILAYTAGLEQVILNGAVLVRGQDYTATDGTTISGLSPALVASDVLEVFSFIAFTVANTYTQSQVDGLLADYAGLRLLVPTSADNGTVGASGAVTFSGVSSVSLNGVFSSTYTAYKIILTTQAATTQGDLKLRMRASGTDTTGSVYSYNHVFLSNSSDTTYNYIRSAGNTTSATIGVISPSQEGMTILDIYNSFTAKNTGWLSRTNNLGAVDTMTTQGGGRVNDTTSYDGITLFNTAGGNISGTIRVYGYKN
jgi:hypothetical protein